MTELEKDLLAVFMTIGVPIGVFLALAVIFKVGEMNTELRGLTSYDWKEVRLDAFAIRCGVHVAIAKWYLNSKARQLNGLREVDDLGDVVYLFGEAKRKFLQQHLADTEVKK